MEIYGRSMRDTKTLLRMREISFLAGPEELRSIATFLLDRAAIQESGDGSDHAHYTDIPDAMPTEVEIVVADPSKIGR